MIYSSDVEWIKYLPEVGTPIMDEVERIKELSENIFVLMEELKARHDVLIADIDDLWTQSETGEAKDQYFLDNQ